MVIINNISSTKFEINGINYFKNFTPLVIGGRVKIVNTYDSDIELMPLTDFDGVTLDGVVYTDIATLQNALLPVIYTRSTLSGGGTPPDLSNYALKANVLEKDNTTPYTPTGDYHPATKKYVDDNAGGSNVSEQRLGNDLVFNNTTGAYYNIETPNNLDITLSETTSISGGKATIFSKSETEPLVITNKKIRKNGAYSIASDQTNVMAFERLPNGDFTVNIWSFDSDLVIPTDLSFLNPLMDIDAENATFDGSNTILTIPDSSGNGNDLTPVGNPKYVADGIYGKPSIRLNGTNRLERVAPIGIADNNKRVVIIVYKLENVTSTGGTYQTISINGVNSFTSAGNYFLIASNNNAESVSLLTNVGSLNASNTMEKLSKHFLIVNKTANSVTLNTDDRYFSSGSGAHVVPDKNIFIGGWNGNGAKMLISKYIVLEDDTLLNTGNNLELLRLHLRTKYNFVDVYNKGITNDSTEQVINRLSDINSNNSENVLLMIGTNDWSYTDGTRKRTPADYKTKLTTIVQSLKSNGSNVILMQIPTILQFSPRTNQICTDNGEAAGCDVNLTGNPYRAKLLEVVSEENTLYIDVENIFNNAPNAISTYYQSDGIHFNTLGTDYLAKSVKAFMISNSIDFNYDNSITCVGDSLTFGLGVSSLYNYPNVLRTIL